MVHKKSFQISVVFVISLFFVLQGCARKKSDIELLAQQQAATIQSLSSEVNRLNDELDQVMQSRQDLVQAKDSLEEQLKSELQSGDMSVSMEARGLVVTMLSRILFDSGKAELKTSAQDTLSKVVDVIQTQVGENVIYVEGHTDNVPIKYSSWKSNWELSTARATEVIHYFVSQKGVDPSRLAAVGYGEYHPVESNDTDKGRLQNRRVEIVISPKKNIKSKPAALA